MGLLFAHCILQDTESQQLPHLKNHDPELLSKAYISTNNDAYNLKYNVHKNIEVSELPVLCARQTFIKNTEEKVRRVIRVEVTCEGTMMITLVVLQHYRSLRLCSLNDRVVSE